jgi:hypothetical protein
MKIEKNILVRYENFNRFGFDRVKFKNIRVIKYDIDTLKDCHHKSYGVAKIRYNSKNLKSLRIERRGIGRLVIRRENSYNIDRGLYARIDFSPTDILGQNIENFSLEELKDVVVEIKNILYEDYKIEIDISNVIFNYCEINYNYLTAGNTKDFEDPLRTLVRFIPYMKICIDIENHKEKDGYESKTITAQNQRHKITFYDKSKETKKKHKNKEIVIVDENGEILNGSIYRYEHTIKKTGKFKNIFEETNLFNLNEEVFRQKLFLYLEKNLFKPYEKQKLMCRNLLMKVVDKYRDKDRIGREWVSLMIIDILIQERYLGYQILFDSEELLEILNEAILRDHNKGRILRNIKGMLCKEPYLYYSKGKKREVDNLIYGIKDQFKDLIK